MTKADLIESIYERVGLTKKDISNIVEDVFDRIRENILDGDNVKISGFGNFEMKKRAKRTGRNPKTGKETEIPPRNVLVFKASKLFKDELNG